MNDMAPVPALQPLIISAPFGNYIQPTGTSPTLGTFTALARPGRVWRILRTVRYYRRLGAWVNRIGLRNPGIDWLARHAAAGKVDLADKLVSIHGFDGMQWSLLLDKTAALHPGGIELNMSCPNVGEVDWPADLFDRAVATGSPIVVKLPPINYQIIADRALDAGVRAFHCCNTLPVPGGGLSGEPLKPLALECIHRLRGEIAGDRADELLLIGGGGIREPDDIDAYAAAGVRHFALGTKVMHPRYLFSTAPLKPLLDRARAHQEQPPQQAREPHRAEEVA